MAVIEAENPVNSAWSVHVMPRTPLKQPTFNLKAADKYQGLCNFAIELKNIFMTNGYNVQDNEKVLIILNLLCRGLHFMQKLNDKEQ